MQTYQDIRNCKEKEMKENTWTSGKVNIYKIQYCNDSWQEIVSISEKQNKGNKGNISRVR